MILYTLRCSGDHTFEQWFANSAEYDALKDAGELVCPECGDKTVSKAIMAPRVAKTTAAPPPLCPAAMGGGCGGCGMK